MNDLKRYMFGYEGLIREGDLVMHERDDGQWLRYDDVKHRRKYILDLLTLAHANVYDALHHGYPRLEHALEDIGRAMQFLRGAESESE